MDGSLSFVRRSRTILFIAATIQHIVSFVQILNQTSEIQVSTTWITWNAFPNLDCSPATKPMLALAINLVGFWNPHLNISLLIHPLFHQFETYPPAGLQQLKNLRAGKSPLLRLVYHRTMNGQPLTQFVPEGKLRIKWLVYPHTSHCMLFVSRSYYQIDCLSLLLRLENLGFQVYLGRVPASASCRRPSSISPTAPRWHRRWPPRTVSQNRHRNAAHHLRGTNHNNQDMGMRHVTLRCEWIVYAWMIYIYICNDMNGWISSLRWRRPSRGGTVVTSAKWGSAPEFERIGVAFGRVFGGARRSFLLAYIDAATVSLQSEILSLSFKRLA